MRQTLLAAGLIVAIAAWRWWGMASSVDLHAHDEFYYLTSGLQMWRGESFPELAWGPAYAAMLALLHHVMPEGVYCFDVMNLLVRVALAFACWWAFRPVLPAGVAWSLGIWLTLLDPLTCDTGAGVMAGGNVYGFGLVWLVFVMGAWLRRRLALALLGACVLVAVRTEYVVFTNILFCGGWLLCVDRRRRVMAGCAVGAIGLLAFAALERSAQARTWLAFEQHYARHAMYHRLHARHGNGEGMTTEAILDAAATINKAFAEPRAIMNEEFPGANNMREAFATAPERAFAYAVSNARAAPAIIVAGMAPRALAGPWLLLFVGALALYGAVHQVGGALRRSRKDRRLFLLIMASLAMLLPSIVITGLRTDLCLPANVALAVGAGFGTSKWLKAMLGRKRGSITCSVIACVLLAGALLSLSRPYISAGQESTPVRDTLAILLQMGNEPLEGKVLVASNIPYPYSVLACAKARSTIGSEAFASATTGYVARLMRDHGVSMVIWDRWLAFELRNAPSVQAELQGGKWRMQARIGRSELYVRMDPSSAPSVVPVLMPDVGK
jgi:hypothetical protein